MKLGTQVCPGHIVLDGDPATLPERAVICYVQIPAWIRMTLGMELNLSAGDFVLDRDQAPPKKAAEPPSQFSAHFYCGQTAGCIKMSLGMEMGLSSGDFVLDGDPCSQPPQKRRGAPKHFRPMHIVQTARWIKTALGSWHEGRLRPRRLYVRWEPIALTPKKGGAPNFRRVSLVTKRLHGSRFHSVRIYASAYATLS